MSSKPLSPIDGSEAPYYGGSGDLTDVTVENNPLTPGNADTPLFYVGADVSTGASRSSATSRD